MAQKTHAHRTFGEDGSTTCECGNKFSSDDLWLAHYESEYSEAKRRELEARPTIEEERRFRRNEKRLAAESEKIARKLAKEDQ